METAGELNDFLRNAVKEYYHNIEPNDIRVIILQAGNRLLPEMSEELANFVMRKLTESGVEVMLNARVTGATVTSELKDGKTIPTHTIIWSGGVASNPIIEELPCEREVPTGDMTMTDVASNNNRDMEMEMSDGMNMGMDMEMTKDNGDNNMEMNMDMKDDDMQ